MNKIKFEDPKLLVIMLSGNDIITTSGEETDGEVELPDQEVDW